MITKNYKKLIKGLMGAVYPHTYKTGSLDKLVSVNGSDIDMTANGFYVSNAISSLASTTFRSSNTSAGFTVGSGTTPATENDYDLESPIYATANTFLSTFIGVNLAKEGTKYIVEYSMSLTNKSNSPISISEIGFVASTSTSSTLKYNVLIDRTVLAEPIVLPADNSPVYIKYTIEFDWDI